MQNPQVIPLTKPNGPAPQVVEHLLDGLAGTPPDLGDTLVVVPTAGAKRAIQHALAPHGVLLPRFCQPMEVLDCFRAPIAPAERVERQAAWLLALEKFPRLRDSLSDGTQELHSLADTLCNLCDSLAEGGLSPASGDLLKALPELAVGRWEKLGALYKSYLKILESHNRRDPNEEHLAPSLPSPLPGDIRRVVICCVPDLPKIVENHLQILTGHGLRVEVLVWSPTGQHERCDAWGRPTLWWAENPPRVEDSNIVVGQDLSAQISLLLERLTQVPGSSPALFATSPEAVAAFLNRLANEGISAYSPEGRPLALMELGAICAGLMRYRGNHHLRDLRYLLEFPEFLKLMRPQRREGEPDPSKYLKACDELLSTYFSASRLSNQTDTFDGRPSLTLEKTSEAVEFLGQELFGMGIQLNNSEGYLYELSQRWCEFPEGSTRRLQMNALGGIGLRMLADIVQKLPEADQDALFQSEINRTKCYCPPEPGAIPIHGWLELPWEEGDVKVLADCREGVWPGGAVEDGFLPDSMREKLGIASVGSRFARDAYLLSCLLGSGQRLLFGVGRFGANGEPVRPSRLLFSCPDEELPQRVRKLFSPPEPAPGALASAFVPNPEWRLNVPVEAAKKVERMRVTSFKAYLECPFRFFLRHVLGIEDTDPEAMEMDARIFGTLIHRVLQDFGEDIYVRHTQDETAIANFLLKNLEKAAAVNFGRPFAPAIELQLEAMKTRLKAAARVQAIEAQKGWRILAVETGLTKKDAVPFPVGPLALTGTIDRIEINHDERRLRVLDYKTFQNAKTPAQTHWKTKREQPGIPEAEIQIAGKTKFWSDLQLPLYSRIVRHLYPDYNDFEVEVGYFLLPAKADETRIEVLPLTAEILDSATRCAAAIASAVQGGVFWPPAQKAEFDPFAAWFQHAPPEQALSPSTIQALQGNPVP